MRPEHEPDDFITNEEIALRAAVESYCVREYEKYDESSNIEIPPEVYQSFLKQLDKQQKRRGHSPALRLRRAVILAILVIVLLVGAAIAVRMHIIKMQIKHMDEYAEMHLQEDGTASRHGTLEDLTGYYALSEIPDGYILTDHYEVAGQHIILYEHPNKGSIYLCQSKAADTSVNADNETEHTKMVAVGTQDGYVFHKNSVTILYWNEGTLLLSLESQELTEKELVSLAESVTVIK